MAFGESPLGELYHITPQGTFPVDLTSGLGPSRSFPLGSAVASHIRISAGASPWEIGGILFVGSHPVEYFADTFGTRLAEF